MGAKLFLPPVLAKKFCVLGRWTVEKPILARLSPDDDRWNIGCDGLPGASDMRDPEVERACCVAYGAWKFDVEFDRFMADEGIGMAEALCETGPRVCSLAVSVRICCSINSCNSPRAVAERRKGLVRWPLWSRGTISSKFLYFVCLRNITCARDAMWWF